MAIYRGELRADKLATSDASHFSPEICRARPHHTLIMASAPLTRAFACLPMAEWQKTKQAQPDALVCREVKVASNF